jgi:hypothetical protein
LSSSSASLALLALQFLIAAAAASAALSFLRSSGNDSATPFFCRRLSAPRHPFFFILAAAVEPSSVVATVKGWTDEPAGVPALGSCSKAPPSNDKGAPSTKAAAAVHSVVSDLAFHLFMTNLGYT